MARPRGSAEQQYVALGLWAKGLSIRAAHLELQSKFTEPVSRGTVGNWFKRFSEGDTSHGDVDRPYRWAEAFDHGIPVEAGYVLNQVVATLNGLSDEQRSVMPDTFISMRRAKWLWRVHGAVNGLVDFTPPLMEVLEKPLGTIDAVVVDAIPNEGDLTPLSLSKWLFMSDVLAKAERAELLTGTTVDVSYIEGQITYRPWESDENQQCYELAVSTGAATADDLDTFYSLFGAIARSNEVLDRREEQAKKQKRT